MRRMVLECRVPREPSSDSRFAADFNVDYALTSWESSDSVVDAIDGTTASFPAARQQLGRPH